MPINPGKNETQDEFISRCVSEVSGKNVAAKNLMTKNIKDNGD